MGKKELNNIEYAIYNLFPPRSVPKSPDDINDNNATPNSGGNLTNAVKEILSNIQVYLAYIIPDLFRVDDIELDTERIIKKDISIKTVNLQNGHGTSDFTTPDSVVKSMVDMLPDSLFVPETRFFDPACKGGEFLFEIYKRLMKSPALIEKYKSQNTRSMYILDEQLFGLALSTKSREITNEVLYGYQKNGNIKSYENYEIKIKNHTYCDSKKTLVLDEVKKLILEDIFKYTFENDKGKKRNMRFDVMIGNPPYSDCETRKGLGSGNALYPAFMAMEQQ